jgi:hypothetical protein
MNVSVEIVRNRTFRDPLGVGLHLDLATTKQKVDWKELEAFMINVNIFTFPVPNVLQG